MITVSGETSFGVPVENFAIAGHNANAYTLQYSVDGVFWSDAGDEVPAYNQLIVRNGIKGMNYRLSGNTNNLEIRY